VPEKTYDDSSFKIKQQLENWQLLGDGEGIHWPEVDEGLSVSGLLIGDH